jgi:hypothetical protein
VRDSGGRTVKSHRLHGDKQAEAFLVCLHPAHTRSKIEELMNIIRLSIDAEESSRRLAEIVAELTKQGLSFNVDENSSKATYDIHITGY